MKQLLPILADIANGIFAVVLAGYITDTEVVWWHFLIGVPFAMLPDVDALPELMQRGKIAASSINSLDHRELLHYPVVFVLAGFVAVYLFGFWGLVFLLATTLHFVNDLYGTGWGIALLWPLTRDRFKVLVDEKNNFSWRVGIRRTPHSALRTEIAKYGNENWIDDIYLNIDPITVIEYGLFMLAIILMFYALLY